MKGTIKERLALYYGQSSNDEDEVFVARGSIFGITERCKDMSAGCGCCLISCLSFCCVSACGDTCEENCGCSL